VKAEMRSQQQQQQLRVRASSVHDHFGTYHFGTLTTSVRTCPQPL